MSVDFYVNGHIISVMNEAIDAYLNLLWTQLQYDIGVFSNPWVLYPVVPALFYFLFFFAKWWILLVPITLPISCLRRSDNSDNIKDQLHELKDKIK